MTSYQSYDDVQLTALLRQGNAQAYTVIYDRYKWILHVHAFKKLGDREAAKDVIQDLFSMLWIKRESIDFKTNLSGYLYTALRNMILNRIAHERVEMKYKDSFDQFVDQNDFVTDHLVRQSQLAALIEKEIDALPAKMRNIFLMSRRENLSHREIALRLNLSEQTVTKQIKNALKILRGKLGFVAYLVFLIKF